jgi:hypothetical protein
VEFERNKSVVLLVKVADILHLGQLSDKIQVDLHVNYD